MAVPLCTQSQKGCVRVPLCTQSQKGYLGYHLTSKLGWNDMISVIKDKVRDRMRIVRSCRIEGSSSFNLRTVLFTTFVKPLFTRLCSIAPLFTPKQYDDLGHFYLTCMKKVARIYVWSDIQFSSYNIIEPFDNLCHRYWTKYKKFLSNSDDGRILYEQACWNQYRSFWLDNQIVVKCMYRSMRFVPFASAIEQSLLWLEGSAEDSLPFIPQEDRDVIAFFPESFI